MNRKVEELIGRVARRQERVRLWLQLAVCWAVSAVVGFGLGRLRHQSLRGIPWEALGLALVATGVAVFLIWRRRKLRPDYRAVARVIELQHPELNGRLLTAVQQSYGAQGEIGYLQGRLIGEILTRQEAGDWEDVVPPARLWLAQITHWAGAVVFALALVGLQGHTARSLATSAPASGVTITPGDTRVERGSTLVVLAHFDGSLPAFVSLVVGGSTGGSNSVLLAKSLADPIFGGTVSEVNSNLVYHIEYDGLRTRDFNVQVFEYPRLERSDVGLSFPDYTGQAAQFTENTRRVTAVEGSLLDLNLHLNKPVIIARLIPKEKGQPLIGLRVDASHPAAALKQFTLEQSATYYDLQLVDAEGLTNKVASQFVFAVQKNHPPEVRLTMPHGDLRPSPLEEVAFAGSVWDDFGVSAYGVGYSVVGEPTRFVQLGERVPAKEKRPFQYLLRLEDVGVQPDQLISWFVWADDLGSDGHVRRTNGDLFFGEIRPFDEIFREGQGGDAQQAGQSGESGGRTARLVELQKQIISATWKLQTATTPRYAEDVLTVRDSQAQALDQAEAGSRRQESRTAVIWPSVLKSMQKAIDQLNQATNSPARLANALPAEQAAYQSLLKLQEHEFQVARTRSQGGSPSDQRMQRQLEQMDLTQSEDRYETQRLAQPAATQPHREQLQVMNRLQELARRQQDLNDRLKELQTALTEARTDQERAELQRRLKRLQEEEQQMLADVDDLRQRMDSPENQAEMAAERRQLDQTRQDVQRAANAAEQGAASQALAAGTRAQKQFKQLHDQMRQQSSSQFADELRSLRSDARQLARDQEDLTRKMQSENDEHQKSLSDSPASQDLVNQLTRDKELVTNLVARAAQVSEQSDQAEPLLSRQLYETVRKFSQQTSKAVSDAQDKLLEQRLMTRSLYDLLKNESQPDSAKLMDLTSELLRMRFMPQANDAAQQARSGLDELKNGVEHAAQSVIGDDSEALRMAREQLSQLAEELQNEIAQGGSGSTNQNSSSPGNRAGSQPSAAGQQGTGEGQPREPSSQAAEAAGSNPASMAGNSGPRGTSLRNGGAAAGGGNGGLAGGPNAGPGGVLDRLLDERAVPVTGPITGQDFVRWSEGLRDVEEMIDQPTLRNQVATARDRVRVMREAFKVERKKPDWAAVNQLVMRPLLEVRDQLSEELARQESKDSLVPIDRDPVPHRYSELVRRYYEELGKDK